jgi:hypothetical protein
MHARSCKPRSLQHFVIWLAGTTKAATENQAGVGGFGDAVSRSLMIRRDLWLYDPAVFTSSL